jgi:hypothetical protein
VRLFFTDDIKISSCILCIKGLDGGPLGDDSVKGVKTDEILDEDDWGVLLVDAR